MQGFQIPTLPPTDSGGRGRSRTGGTTALFWQSKGAHFLLSFPFLPAPIHLVC
jgi:hypothetical protein